MRPLACWKKSNWCINTTFVFLCGSGTIRSFRLASACYFNTLHELRWRISPQKPKKISALSFNCQWSKCDPNATWECRSAWKSMTFKQNRTGRGRSVSFFVFGSFRKPVTCLVTLIVCSLMGFLKKWRTRRMITNSEQTKIISLTIQKSVHYSGWPPPYRWRLRAWGSVELKVKCILTLGCNVWLYILAQCPQIAQLVWVRFA